MTVRATKVPISAPWEVGQVREVPFHLSTQTLHIECVVIDTRKAFGRTEWQIAPVSGSGSAWVRDDGPRVGGPTHQQRHEATP